jgi:hypothetical protein
MLVRWPAAAGRVGWLAIALTTCIHCPALRLRLCTQQQQYEQNNKMFPHRKYVRREGSQ